MREIILEKPRDLCLFSVCYTTLGTDDLAGNTDFSPNIFSIKYVCVHKSILGNSAALCLPH